MKHFIIVLIIPSFLILLIILHPLIGFSDTIELITGKSIDGKFIKGDYQAITITTEKGEKKIPINSISRIIFKEISDHETIEKALEKGTLKGVITYYFNKNYGDKPDVGSKVYVMRIKKNWGKETNFFSNPEVEDFVNGLWTYRKCINLRSIIELSSDIRSLLPGEDTLISKLTEELREIGADTEEGFKRIDERSYKILNDIEKFDKIRSYHAVADGDGQFELQLPPGSYFVVVLSNHREGHYITKTEFHNALYVTFKDIKEREVNTVATSFSPH